MKDVARRVPLLVGLLLTLCLLPVVARAADADDDKGKAWLRALQFSQRTEFVRRSERGSTSTVRWVADFPVPKPPKLPVAINLASPPAGIQKLECANAEYWRGQGLKWLASESITDEVKAYLGIVLDPTQTGAAHLSAKAQPLKGNLVLGHSLDVDLGAGSLAPVEVAWAKAAATMYGEKEVLGVTPSQPNSGGQAEDVGHRPTISGMSGALYDGGWVGTTGVDVASGREVWVVKSDSEVAVELSPNTDPEKDPITWQVFLGKSADKLDKYDMVAVRLVAECDVAAERKQITSPTFFHLYLGYATSSDHFAYGVTMGRDPDSNHRFFIGGLAGEGGFTGGILFNKGLDTVLDLAKSD